MIYYWGMITVMNSVYGPIQYLVRGRSAQMVNELSDGPIQYLLHGRPAPGNLCIPKSSYPVHLHRSHDYCLFCLCAIIVVGRPLTVVWCSRGGFCSQRQYTTYSLTRQLHRLAHPPFVVARATCPWIAHKDSNKKKRLSRALILRYEM